MQKQLVFCNAKTTWFCNAACKRSWFCKVGWQAWRDMHATVWVQHPGCGMIGMTVWWWVSTKLEAMMCWCVHVVHTQSFPWPATHKSTKWSDVTCCSWVEPHGCKIKLVLHQECSRVQPAWKSIWSHRFVKGFHKRKPLTIIPEMIGRDMLLMSWPHDCKIE